MKSIYLFFVLIGFSLSAQAGFVITDHSNQNGTITSLTSKTISAYGSGYTPYLDKGEIDCCDGKRSILSVYFDILEPTIVEFDVSLSSSGDSYEQQSMFRLYDVESGDYLIGALSQAVDSSASADDWVTDYASEGSPLSFQRQLTLAAGSYQLTASALADLSGYSEGNSSYDFTMTAVPVPAAAWLFGSALLGLFAQRKRC